MTASAPGKVLWSGEYAVLDGAPAVVTAVTRRAVARVTDETHELSPFLAAVRDELGPRADHVFVDSTSLSDGDRKLGLGSSAAATVAAVAAVLGETGARVHEIAHRAHARAQAARGARGSGADIAASVHGGVLEVRRTGEDTPVAVRRLALPASLELVLVWTGSPADTPSLVAAVRAFRDRDPRGHAAAIEGIATASSALIAALEARDAQAVVAAIAAGAGALEELAARSGAPLVPPVLAAASALARTHGGAAKPTGAGGGDLILAVFPGPSAPFRAAARAAGMIVVTASVDPDGVSLA